MQHTQADLLRALSQQFVHAHGGRIALQSEPGRGASFEMLLPLTPPTSK